MMIKKLLATFFCFIIIVQIISPNIVNAYSYDEVSSAQPNYISKKVFQNGKVQLINEGSKIIVITDEPSSSNVQSNTIGPPIENRVSQATVYIPDTSEYHEKIYAYLDNTLRTNSYAELEGDDKNHCATFFLKVYYNKFEADDRYIYFDLTSVSGGFRDQGTTGSDLGENVKVWEQWINVAQSGSHLDNYEFGKSQTDTYRISPSNRNWTYTPPSEWIPVSDAGAGAIVGVKYNFILGRGNSSWESEPLNISLLSTLNWEY